MDAAADGPDRPDARWPDLFLIGAAKAGTTTLHRHLAAHPEVFMAEEKEPHFFSWRWDEVGDDPEGLARAEAEYLRRFEEAGDAAVVGEASTSYLTSSRVPGRIADRCDDPRFLVSLRDPVERCHSHFLMTRRDGGHPRPFEETVAAGLDEARAGGRLPPFVSGSRYHTALSRWVDQFGLDPIHVVLAEHLRDRPLDVLKGIAEFVGVDASPFRDLDLDRVANPHRAPRNVIARWLRTSPTVKTVARAVVPRPVRVFLGDEVLMEPAPKPPLDPGTVDRLWEEVYSPEIDSLEGLLGRPLPELRKTQRSRNQAS